MITWECHERYLQRLFQHLRREPCQGYVKPTVQQLLRADRQVFLQMIQKDVKVRRTAQNTLEMDTEIFEALASYEVGFHPIPLPKSSVKKLRRPITTSPTTLEWTKSSGKGKKGKDKGQKGKFNILPKPLQGRDNVNMDPHGRSLCFDYNLASHSFAGPGRVAASLKALGLAGSFGKCAMAQKILADLTKPEGVKLLWQWLQDERVVGLFLAPPCGSASRASQIPMSNKRKFHGPRPLRTDSHPNRRLNLSFKDRQRVSLANKLYTTSLQGWSNGLLFQTDASYV